MSICSVCSLEHERRLEPRATPQGRRGSFLLVRKRVWIAIFLGCPHAPQCAQIAGVCQAGSAADLSSGTVGIALNSVLFRNRVHAPFLSDLDTWWIRELE